MPHGGCWGWWEDNPQLKDSEEAEEDDEEKEDTDLINA